MKKILINATQDEIRVAIQKDNNLYDLDLEIAGFETKIANVYKGVITRVEPSLEACFVDFGSNRHGFLPLREIAYSIAENELPESDQKRTISQLVQEGQEIMIQVEKGERGNKGAALTTFISLAGSYLVLMPNNPRAGGVSRRIDGNQREELKSLLSQLKYPSNMGVIIRTAGLGRNLEELQWDLDVLLKQWEVIEQAYQKKSAPFLIYRESDIVIRAIRDYLRPSIEEIIVDCPNTYEKAKDYIGQIRPDYLNRLKLYDKATPLYVHYKLENQIESAFQREVKLPSGGRIVIDYTEALVSIDINSSKATKGGDIEETALNTNLEAATEVAKQMRLRDLSGLIVIDFIDMTPVENQVEVENRLRDACKDDRARVQISRISRFGLLELSRQRLRPVLDEFKQSVCPRCNGRGTIRDVHSVAASILRLLEEASVKSRSKTVYAELPIDVATYLLNNRREAISAMQTRHDSNIVLIPNSELLSPHYKIGRSRTLNKPKSSKPLPDYLEETLEEAVVREEAAVGRIKPTTPNPITTKLDKKDGLIKRLWSGLFTKDEQPEQPSPHKRSKSSYHGRRRTHSSTRRNTSSSSTGNRRGRASQHSSTSQKSHRTTDRKQHSSDRRQTSNKQQTDRKKTSRPRRRHSNQRNEQRKQDDRKTSLHSSTTEQSVIDKATTTPGSINENKKDNRPEQQETMTKSNGYEKAATETKITGPLNPLASAPANQFIKSNKDDGKPKSTLQKVETKHKPD